DTGFGNAINTRRTVRELERAGANGIQLEDQQFPKRCGHFEGKALIPVGEMVQKIHAAVDARTDSALQIIARTDARAVEGFEPAVERALAYADAGADVLFLEAPQTLEELAGIPALLPRPCLLNLVEGGRTPIVTAAEASDYAVVLFANAALQASIRAMQSVLGTLRETGSLAAVTDQLAPWRDRQAMVRKPFFDELDTTYATGEPAP
ncbi:MAG: carboxyvinyl-carboxyphosphonate phosphorylmutase, partial [Frankiales bacterium]|nr:carboxyvinyl-carboxyphosphonate phosphorylmutase [Frankiales bacterium]